MGEIIILAGPPGGGKTTVTQRYYPNHVRVNRDTLGGNTMSPTARIYEYMREQYAQGARDFILDNTHPTVEHRAVVIQVAKELGLPVRCFWLDTNLGEAQFLAALRQVRKTGKLLYAHEYAEHKGDPNLFPPAAQFAYFKRFEEPSLDEGLDDIVRVPFRLELPPEYRDKALFLDYDGTLRETRSGDKWPVKPDDIRPLPGRGEKIRAYADRGYHIIGVSNQSGCSRKPGEKGYLTHTMASECFRETDRLLGIADVDRKHLYAPDRGGPPRSFWRKPCPGMGALAVEQLRLDPKSCLMVGDRKEDQTFAERCGFLFEHADAFFE